MTTLHLIMNAICRVLATSGVARWGRGLVVVSEVQEAHEIEIGRQGAAGAIPTNGRVRDPFTDTSRAH